RLHLLSLFSLSFPHLLFDLPAQPLYRRLLKQRPHRYLYSKHLPYSRHHLRRQQRVPSHLKKVLSPPDLLPPHYLSPDPSQQLLYLVPSPFSLSLLSPFFSSLHSLSIYLPVPRQHKLSLPHVPHWHHVLRHPLSQVLPHLPFFPLLPLSRHHVRH